MTLNWIPKFDKNMKAGLTGLTINLDLLNYFIKNLRNLNLFDNSSGS